MPPKPKQVFVKTVPPTIGRAELEAFFSQVKGFEYLALTEPSVKKAFHRVAWAQFGEGVDIADAVGQLDGKKVSFGVDEGWGGSWVGRSEGKGRGDEREDMAERNG